MCNGYKISNVNRQGRHGGGTALIYKQPMTIKIISKGVNRSFDYAIWDCNISNTAITVVGLYHPPYSGTNKCTDAMFLDDLAEFLEEVLTSYSNIIIAGDFNLHVDDKENPDAQVFVDLLTAFGLQNHIDFPTNKSKHTLDLIISESISHLEVKDSSPAQYLSDHTSVISHLSIDKPPLEVKKCTYRRLKEIDMDEISTKLDHAFENFETTDLETMIEDLEKQLKLVLDEIAPEKTKTIVVRPTNPWFTEDVKTQKRLMRNRERTWRKYKLQSNWIAFKVKRNKYRAMLKSIRKTTVSEKINECKQDTKKLYAFVNNIIGRESENPLPKRESDEQLAEEFADHLMAKIKKIQDALENHPIYKPEHRDIDQLKEFQPLLENEMLKLLGKCQANHAKLIQCLQHS